MRSGIWPGIGIVLVGALGLGSCAGAVIGQFTVTGAMSPNWGWGVPTRGAEVEAARLPPVTTRSAVVSSEPQFVGYAPVYRPEVEPAVVFDDPAFDMEIVDTEPVRVAYAAVEPPDVRRIADDAANDRRGADQADRFDDAESYLATGSAPAD